MHFSSGFLLTSALLLAASVSAQAGPVDTAATKVEQLRPDSAAELFAQFAKMPGLEARYAEKKHVGLLTIPLQSNGILYFMRGGYLARLVQKPRPSLLAITPTQLRMEDENGVEVVDLRQSPEMRLFVTSLARVFSGDRKELGASYKMAFETQADDKLGWTLLLTPRAKPLTNMVKSLRLRGRGYSVTQIEMREPNGDHSVMSVKSADAEREFSDEEKLKLFGLDGKGDRSKPKAR